MWVGLDCACCDPLYSKASRSPATGAEVMKRIAAPMIGGMVSSTILTLLVSPVLYAMWRWREMKRLDCAGIRSPAVTII